MTVHYDQGRDGVSSACRSSAWARDKGALSKAKCPQQQLAAANTPARFTPGADIERSYAE